jgi:hypothetical protein
MPVGFSPVAQSAPLGSAFTYQGYLTDGGAPAEGEFDFVFGLYAEASGGDPLGEVELEQVSIAGGYFTVLLDFGGGVFDGNARWLEIGVRLADDPGPYTPLLPRQPLTPAPYAVVAGYATTTDWFGIANIPAGFADGIDNDTLYAAGTGLDLSGNQFNLADAFQLP